MKKLFALLLVAILAFAALPALAAGRINVTEEDFYTIKGSSSYTGYVFARLENVGDKPIMVNTGLLEIFDSEGDPITSSDSFSAYARYLAPGDYTYFRMSAKIDEISSADDVDDYLLTVSGKSHMDKATLRLATTSDYQENVQNGYSTYNYMYAVVTNDTEEPVYQPYVVFALLDADDKILYLTSDSLDSNEAIMPGSSIMVRVAVDSSFVNYCKDNELTPVKVDAIGYAYVNKED